MFEAMLFHILQIIALLGAAFIGTLVYKKWKT